MSDIIARLRAHLEGDGTPNDATTDLLYREAYGIPEKVETDLEAVEKWAFEMLNSTPAKTSAMTPEQRRELRRACLDASVDVDEERMRQDDDPPCDHEWEFLDESFSHAFGTEKIHSLECQKCGATKPAKPSRP